MKIVKRKLADLPMAYAVCSMKLNGATHFLAATEDQGMCLMFSPPDWVPSIVWPGPGGVMSLVPLELPKPALLAIERFFPIFKSEGAGVILAEPGPCATKPWRTQRVLDLPFVHRIEVVPVGGAPCLVAATLCAGKIGTDDWSQPGAVYAGLLPQSQSDSWRVKPILEGITRNHGLHVTRINDRRVVLVAGEEGLFSLDVPVTMDKSWRSAQLSDRAVSDIFCADIDGDGMLELAAIEPFHGDCLALYRLRPNGFERLWEMPLNFGHVAWMGHLVSGPAIIVGNRAGDRELILLRLRQNSGSPLEVKVIDRDIGPTQIVLARNSRTDLVLSANHAANEVVLYEITE